MAPFPIYLLLSIFSLRLLSVVAGSTGQDGDHPSPAGDRHFLVKNISLIDHNICGVKPCGLSAAPAVPELAISMKMCRNSSLQTCMKSNDQGQAPAAVKILVVGSDQDNNVKFTPKQAKTQLSIPVEDVAIDELTLLISFGYATSHNWLWQVHHTPVSSTNDPSRWQYAEIFLYRFKASPSPPWLLNASWTTYKPPAKAAIEVGRLHLSWKSDCSPEQKGSGALCTSLWRQRTTRTDPSQPSKSDLSQRSPTRTDPSQRSKSGHALVAVYVLVAGAFVVAILVVCVAYRKRTQSRTRQRDVDERSDRSSDNGIVHIANDDISISTESVDEDKPPSFVDRQTSISSGMIILGHEGGCYACRLHYHHGHMVDTILDEMAWEFGAHERYRPDAGCTWHSPLANDGFCCDQHPEYGNCDLYIARAHSTTRLD